MKNRNVLVTGGAGFIGSHLIDSLLAAGCDVTCVDNLSLGTTDNISHLQGNPSFRFQQLDLCEMDGLDVLFASRCFDMVFHMAANSDIQKGGQQPDIDFQNTFMTTRNIIEAMRRHQVKRIFFASTSAVYGEKCDVALTEDIGGLLPVSYYGGAKLAAEALLSSYTFMNDFETLVFRFPNVIGPRLTHGVIFDFIRKLRANPRELEILGDGNQCKPYIFVSDLVSAIAEKGLAVKPGFEIFNIGVETMTSVRTIADIVTKGMGLENVTYRFTGGDRGWKGDVPRFSYDLSKIHATGWRPRFTSDEAVARTVAEVL